MDPVDQFTAITGASADIAAQFVEMSGGDVDMAIGLFFSTTENSETSQSPPQPPQPHPQSAHQGYI